MKKISNFYKISHFFFCCFFLKLSRIKRGGTRGQMTHTLTQKVQNTFSPILERKQKTFFSHFFSPLTTSYQRISLRIPPPFGLILEKTRGGILCPRLFFLFF